LAGREQPIFENSPNPLLDNAPFPLEAILSQPNYYNFSFPQVFRATLVIPSSNEKLKVKSSLKVHFLLQNLAISLIILGMFYIYYRLSRTGRDDLTSNLKVHTQL
jgi:hypothetical protein